MSKTCFCGISEHCGYQIETDMAQHDKVIYEQGYNRAIDDFAELICEKASESSERCVFPGGISMDVITLDYISDMVLEVAEQLKGEKQ